MDASAAVAVGAYVRVNSMTRRSGARATMVRLYSDCTGMLLDILLAGRILGMIIVPPGCQRVLGATRPNVIVLHSDGTKATPYENGVSLRLVVGQSHTADVGNSSKLHHLK